MTEVDQLPGLRAWDVQRRNHRRRWLGRVLMASVVITAACAFAPDRFNPAVHAGLLEARGLMRLDASQQIAAVAAAREAAADIARHGLPRLGEAAPSLLAAAPYAASDLLCLTKAVYFEARGESIEGQIAVAQVVMNRHRAAGAGATICQIVYMGADRGEKCQFSFACRGHTLPPATSHLWLQAAWIAEDVAAGRAYLRELEQAQHYHTVAVKPVWRLSLRPVRRIGQHIFYVPWGTTPDLRMVSKAPTRWDEASNPMMIDEAPGEQTASRIIPTSGPAVGMSPVKRPPAPPSAKPSADPSASGFMPFASTADAR